jgi:uncharacterized protein
MSHSSQSADEAAWSVWCGKREKALAAPDSWLGLVGLFWLEAGGNAVGSDGDCEVRLPSGPGRLGEIEWQPASAKAPGTLRWRANLGKAVSVGETPTASETWVDLQSDANGTPSILAFDNLRFFVIERDGGLAVRVKNLAWATQTPFAGLTYFPFAPAWVVDAAWDQLAVPLRIEVPSVTGELKPTAITHQAVFELAGATVVLLPLSVDERKVFFVFRDKTSGALTYGGGRFLDCAPPFGGRIRLDFNRAYNPPCAFSPFATCPLPPPENWLHLSLEAGEKKYAAGH